MEMLSPAAFEFDTKCTSFSLRVRDRQHCESCVASCTGNDNCNRTGCVIDNEVSSKRVNGLHKSIPRPSFGTAVSTCFSGQSNSTVTCFRQWANVKLEGPIDAVGKVSSLSFVSHLYVCTVCRLHYYTRDGIHCF